MLGAIKELAEQGIALLNNWFYMFEAFFLSIV
jgi:hypothetical protein